MMITVYPGLKDTKVDFALSFKVEHQRVDLEGDLLIIKCRFMPYKMPVASPEM